MGRQISIKIDDDTFAALFQLAEMHTSSVSAEAAGILSRVLRESGLVRAEAETPPSKGDRAAVLAEVFRRRDLGEPGESLLHDYLKIAASRER